MSTIAMSANPFDMNLPDPFRAVEAFQSALAERTDYIFNLLKSGDSFIFSNKDKPGSKTLITPSTNGGLFQATTMINDKPWSHTVIDSLSDAVSRLVETGYGHVLERQPSSLSGKKFDLSHFVFDGLNPGIKGLSTGLSDTVSVLDDIRAGVNSIIRENYFSDRSAKVQGIYAFGSRVLGNSTVNSDLNILVHFGGNLGEHELYCYLKRENVTYKDLKVSFTAFKGDITEVAKLHSLLVMTDGIKTYSMTDTLSPEMIRIASKKLTPDAVKQMCDFKEYSPITRLFLLDMQKHYASMDATNSFTSEEDFFRFRKLNMIVNEMEGQATRSNPNGNKETAVVERALSEYEC